ncbi:GNAT family N-acetyltransferase [Thalassospiraceae bacterium LMO-JJ14]|nr:GNAT family N-acetyltransferase [Thalassospiraceae bacterium LMO-JJ14]
MPDGSEQRVIKTLSSISAIPAEAWDACAGTDNPFVRHAFLWALEESGSATDETGWIPRHLVIEAPDGRIEACAPLYLKTHSYGEYIFDWAWADAYERAGGRYYPKMQCAVPFTPVPGPRLLVAPDADAALRNELQKLLLAGLIRVADQLKVSSAHITFCEKELWELGKEARYLHRLGQQFHWHNDGYSDFDDFLGALSSRKRKTIRKERQKVADLGLDIRTLAGSDLEERHWDAFFDFYMSTTDKKWGQSYLHREFFSMLGERMADAVVMVMAFDGTRPVAGALNLLGHDCLYGRNWGSLQSHKFLHFECCYYRAIDYAIEHGLDRVEAGAQGPHKVQRGYLPSPIYSLHYIRDPGFESAVDDFLTRERTQMRHEMQAIVAEYSPYRQTEND